MVNTHDMPKDMAVAERQTRSRSIKILVFFTILIVGVLIFSGLSLLDNGVDPTDSTAPPPNSDTNVTVPSSNQ